MSEFQAHLSEHGDQLPPPPQTTSGWSIASLVCSLIVCCPLVTIFGPILGAVALAKIGSPPRYKGKGLAIAGIILGILTTLGSAAGLYWAYKWGEFAFTGTNDALTAGYAGDIAGFKDHFSSGGNLTDEQAQAFLDETEERYGTFINARFDETEDPEETSQQGVMRFFIVYEFSDQTMNGDAEVDFTEMKLQSIRIVDPDEGDIQFPPAP